MTPSQELLEAIPKIKHIQGLVSDESPQQVVLMALEELLKSIYAAISNFESAGEGETAEEAFDRGFFEGKFRASFVAAEWAGDRFSLRDYLRTMEPPMYPPVVATRSGKEQ